MNGYEGRIHYEVAVDSILPTTLTYYSDKKISAGCRVIVPLGRANRKTLGVVLGQGEAPEGIAAKAIGDIMDSSPFFSETLIVMGRWLADYYFFPIGQVFKTMLPGGTKVKKLETVFLLPAGLEAQKDHDHPHYPVIKSIFGGRSSLRRKTFLSKIERLYPENPQQPLGLLRSQKLIEESNQRNLDLRQQGRLGEAAPEIGVTKDMSLTPDQEAVFREIERSFSERQPIPVLLWGVTGAGKTEIYLHLIESLLARAADQQALVLVPEISLTPQMTHVFSLRFPGQVVVVHSALDDKDRWKRLEAIRSQEKRILIGPRSAVFAPFKSLGLIIVDEEHDSSYKQGSGLRYNGRDVAVLRAKLEGCPVVLGSATPSLESFYNVQLGKFQLQTLHQRHNQGPLPELQVVEQKTKPSSGQSLSGGFEDVDIPVQPEIIDALRANYQQRMQSIVIVNRRGYAYFLFSRVSKKTVQCPSCSVSMTVHKQKFHLKCHYCDYTTPLAPYLAKPHGEYLLVGYGSEQAEQFLAQSMPEANIVRVDSDTVAKKGELEKILSAFRSGEIDILVGTQILAKGHDFPKVTLICLLEVDQMLNLPDFRAGERTFQLIVQAAGRAGRAEHPGKVLMQSRQPHQETMRAAMKQDYQEFVAQEIAFRRQHFFPPIAKMILIEFNGPHKDVLDQFVRNFDAFLKDAMLKNPSLFQKVHILGPAVPAIEKVRNRWRRTLLLSAQSHLALRELSRFLLESLKKLPRGLRMIVDVDPQAII